jgi:HEAT repeat protein
MIRRALTLAVLLGAFVCGSCEDCPLPGCDTCASSPCVAPCGSTCSPCSACGPCARCESAPAPDTRHSEDLVAALKTPDRATRDRAVDTLARRGTEIIPQIETLLSDPDANVRFAALEVLVRLRHDAWPSVYHVKWRLQDQDPAVRAEAATVIGATGHCAAEAIPQLICALDDSSALVRYRAAIAFQVMDGLAEPGRGALERHSHCDRDPRVREACRCALWHLDQAICHQPDVPQHG